MCNNCKKINIKNKHTHTHVSDGNSRYFNETIILLLAATKCKINKICKDIEKNLPWISELIKREHHRIDLHKDLMRQRRQN